MSSHYYIKKITYSVALFFSLSAFSVAVTHAETVSGGGYTVFQVMTPFADTLSGNGYTLQGSMQESGDVLHGSQAVVRPIFGNSSSSQSSSSSSSNTSPSPGGGGGGGGGYGGWVASTSYYYINQATSSSSGVPMHATTTCASRIALDHPIEYGSEFNDPLDVKKLETFLNTFEKEKLPVDGVYDVQDVLAVKRWQRKYAKIVLAPMKLKEPTGTVYALSMRQIERQSSSACGVPIVITACPYFKMSLSPGFIGEQVKKLQFFLNIVRGERLPVNGVYGPRTKEAVKRFQKATFTRTERILGFPWLGEWGTLAKKKANALVGCGTL